MCAESGVKTPATVCDHIERHRGNPAKFFGGPFQSLCKPCHDGRKQSQDRLGYSTKVGADGLPTDPKHPFYR